MGDSIAVGALLAMTAAVGWDEVLALADDEPGDVAVGMA